MITTSGRQGDEDIISRKSFTDMNFELGFEEGGNVSML